MGFPPVAPRTTTAGSLRFDGITFGEIAGYRPLLLDLHVPVGDGLFPVVVWIHGGAFLFGDRRYLPSTLEPDSVFDAFVAAGIACATIDYRLSGEATYPAQLEDVLLAIDYLREHAAELGVDGERLGLSGESAGGMLASLAGLIGARISAIAPWYAPSDMAGSSEEPEGRDGEPGVMERLMGGTFQDLPDLWAHASAVTHVSASSPPFLLIHGDEDAMVPVGQSESLHRALTAAGATSTLRIVPGADHCFERYDDIAGLIAETVVFFAEHL